MSNLDQRIVDKQMLANWGERLQVLLEEVGSMSGLSGFKIEVIVDAKNVHDNDKGDGAASLSKMEHNSERNHFADVKVKSETEAPRKRNADEDCEDQVRAKRMAVSAKEYLAKSLEEYNVDQFDSFAAKHDIDLSDMKPEAVRLKLLQPPAPIMFSTRELRVVFGSQN